MPIDGAGASIADWISGGWNGCPAAEIPREGKAGNRNLGSGGV
jgi:hypothetical protein